MCAIHYRIFLVVTEPVLTSTLSLYSCDMYAINGYGHDSNEVIVLYLYGT